MISTVFVLCASELATVHTTAPPVTSHTTSAVATPAVGCPPCAIIASAANSCANDQCICPTLVQFGPACTSCLATVNATAASEIGSILTNCRSMVQSPTSNIASATTSGTLAPTTGSVVQNTLSVVSTTSKPSVANSTKKLSEAVYVFILSTLVCVLFGWM